ncbi:hypothetical protein [Streptomyces sp. IBSBF 2435]|uniref:hypothetical protein n=1 Tax=Streptomyces sp. IBSBF 2435 TaxID=2903531 RepID=UPI002FDC76C3
MSPLSTPVADACFSSLSHAAAEAIAALDAVALREQKARMAPWAAEKLREATNSVPRRSREWERLTARIVHDWPPDGTYLVDEYVNDLATRDTLERTKHELPASAATEFTAMLTRLDDAFREVTVDDGGASIAWRTNASEPDLAQRPWWWHRRPVNAPWT